MKEWGENTQRVSQKYQKFIKNIRKYNYFPYMKLNRSKWGLKW